MCTVSCKRKLQSDIIYGWSEINFDETDGPKTKIPSAFFRADLTIHPDQDTNRL